MLQSGVDRVRKGHDDCWFILSGLPDFLIAHVFPGKARDETEKQVFSRPPSLPGHPSLYAQQRSDIENQSKY